MNDSEMNYIDEIAEDIFNELAIPSSEWQLYLPLCRLYALLALALHVCVSREDVHDAWSVWMAGRDPGHRSLVPFNQLTAEVQALDQPYVDAIHRVAMRRWPV